MKIAYGTEKPSIYVYYSSSITDISIFHQLIWGIEEEGIPYQWIRQTKGEALELSFMAAEASSLGVGVGIGDDRLIILHYGKLPYEMPLFQIPHASSPSMMRAIGANAARLVKGIPFKEIDHKNNREDQYPSEMESDLKSMIARVLEEINQKMKA